MTSCGPKSLRHSLNSPSSFESGKESLNLLTFIRISSPTSAMRRRTGVTRLCRQHTRVRTLFVRPRNVLNNSGRNQAPATVESVGKSPQWKGTNNETIILTHHTYDYFDFPQGIARTVFRGNVEPILKAARCSVDTTCTCSAAYARARRTDFLQSQNGRSMHITFANDFRSNMTPLSLYLGMDSFTKRITDSLSMNSLVRPSLCQSLPFRQALAMGHP